MKLSGVLIGTDDPARLKAYYTKLFGKPTWEDQGYFGWQFGDGGVAFGAHSEVKGKNAQPGRMMWSVESADVKGDFEKLKAAEPRSCASRTTWAMTPVGSRRCRIRTTTTSSS